MDVVSLDIPDVKIIRPKKFGDHRGFFSETYSRKAFEAAGLLYDFVQDNQSLSAEVGTVRGLHFQLPPFAQDKLVRVVKGAILDVAVDIRKGSPTYGRHVSAVVSAEEWNQILVPIGFAHGFCTLEPNTEVIYKVTNFYSAEHDRGLLWNDPDLGIDWPVAADKALLSDKDRKQPRFAELGDWF
ncbi:dTDP-4-dehydrorhamnose 3,5-epimerase (plasmid) [Azospirillum argentinense]|uniref:dTDP-4-dehydrorhamnose 3,5-epimerase n=1 Tax=Azospirillum argentinense TaxID=2970906 RepID=A0A5B0KQ46_9PROT|nr:dTDP-4-dehydrorhamnose 3,5-epimerase [Azospirillum argentinense]AIB16640.1 dTDP-4-dehydrorhamnose 3,5-epimerase [Azospirillum argentinense]EZQ02342.1 dTDP-4-dehydrorhamnose 3,5-epimerase [Azospirillum argentinense]KAA1054016.1 dTDP-4-dehydrorhamnose 3,5-epimerase [Azospirillum argentinense]MBK3801216.1 dTDP-4-dehydrorhamnose 3,5-epimerase [Azospirillum argentinense]PNQ96582.1 dTDP-4-dehydrorhamnose 3,5-epimerase [Azospirillum argentinense]